MESEKITVKQVKAMIDSDEPVLFIDTRSPNAWRESDEKLPGALRIHYQKLEEHIDDLPRDNTIVTYCT